MNKSQICETFVIKTKKFWQRKYTFLYSVVPVPKKMKKCFFLRVGLSNMFNIVQSV